MPNILIVDDELGIRESLKGILEDEGFTAGRAVLLDFAPDEAVRKKILVDNPARLYAF